MVAIRLKRMGSKAKPYYRIVVTDSRKNRDGRSIEEVGYYHPMKEGTGDVKINEDRVKYWISVGAQVSDTVGNILKREGLFATQ